MDIGKFKCFSAKNKKELDDKRSITTVTAAKKQSSANKHRDDSTDDAMTNYNSTGPTSVRQLSRKPHDNNCK